MKTRIAGQLIFLFVIVSSIYFSGRALCFIHLPSLLFVIIASGGLALMKYRKGDGKLGFIINMKRYSILSGVIGSLIDLVTMGRRISSLDQYSAGVAVAVLAAFYGLIFYCIVDTFIAQEHTTA